MKERRQFSALPGQSCDLTWELLKNEGEKTVFSITWSKLWFGTRVLSTFSEYMPSSLPSSSDKPSLSSILGRDDALGLRSFKGNTSLQVGWLLQFPNKGKHEIILQWFKIYFNFIIYAIQIKKKINLKEISNLFFLLKLK